MPVAEQVHRSAPTVTDITRRHLPTCYLLGMNDSRPFAYATPSRIGGPCRWALSRVGSTEHPRPRRIGPWKASG
jgi:hypothetical protein